MDFDAHSGGKELESQKDRAIRAFTLLLEYRDRHLILSASGRGYHVFVFAREPRPVAEWTALLTDTEGLLPEGQCEIFPAKGTERQRIGKAIRMPGTYNPTSDSVEMIMAETIQPLLDHIEGSNCATSISNLSSLGGLLDREANSYSYSRTYYLGDNSDQLGYSKTVDPKSPKLASKALANFRFLSRRTDALIEEVLKKHPVEEKSTRHGALVTMTGELFHKFGWQLSKSVAEAHYRRNREKINSSIDEHMREFANIWKFIHGHTLDTFSGSGGVIYDQLRTQPQQEAFLIARSFAHAYKGENFPISQNSLADRVSLDSQPGARGVILRLIEVKAIEKSADYRIHKTSTLYRWTANKDELPLQGFNTAIQQNPS